MVISFMRVSRLARPTIFKLLKKVYVVVNLNNFSTSPLSFLYGIINGKKSAVAAVGD